MNKILSKTLAVTIMTFSAPSGAVKESNAKVAPPDAILIAPQKGLAKIKLGMEKSAVELILGKAQSIFAGTEDQPELWSYLSKNRQRLLQLQFKDNKVAVIYFNSEEFLAVDGRGLKDFKANYKSEYCCTEQNVKMRKYIMARPSKGFTVIARTALGSDEARYMIGAVHLVEGYDDTPDVTVLTYDAFEDAFFADKKNKPEEREFIALEIPKKGTHRIDVNVDATGEIYELELRDPKGRLLQTISNIQIDHLARSKSPREMFRQDDVNFDGYPDLTFTSLVGVTGNEGTSTYFFDPSKGTFDSTTFDASNMQLRPESKQILTDSKCGYSCHRSETYRITSGRPVLWESWSTDPIESVEDSRVESKLSKDFPMPATLSTHSRRTADGTLVTCVTIDSGGKFKVLQGDPKICPRK